MILVRPSIQLYSLHLNRHRAFHAGKRLHSHEPPPAKQLYRLQSLNDRLPRIVRRWTTPLLRAPASQVVSFLLLHEATAVIPLFGLVGLMHYTSWTPPMMETAWVIAAVEKFGKYGRRKGWIKDSDVLEAERQVVQIQQDKQPTSSDSPLESKTKAAWTKLRNAWRKKETIWGRGEVGVRLLVEFGTAWAIVKALLIPRLALSAWATPWFARVAVEPVMKAMARRGGNLLGRASAKGSNKP